MESLVDKKLCEEIRRYPHLYNSTLKEHKDIQMAANSWKEIATTVGKDENFCKQKWKYLRDRYVKAKRKMIGRSGNSSVPPIIPALDWLSSFIKHRQTESNYPEETEREPEADRAQRRKDEKEERSQGEGSVQAEGPGEVRAEEGEKDNGNKSPNTRHLGGTPTGPVFQDTSVGCTILQMAHGENAVCLGGNIPGPESAPTPSRVCPSPVRSPVRSPSPMPSPSLAPLSSPLPSPLPSQSAPRLRKRRESPSITEELWTKLQKVEKEWQEEPDEILFGRMVGRTLMRLPLALRDDCQHEIEQVLYRYKKLSSVNESQ
ncbi:uncharacterized protein KZ484_001271 [Pholidichthys leucotaenia]